MKKIYKFLPLFFLMVLNFNVFSLASEMYCWEETRKNDDSIMSNYKGKGIAGPSTSYLYNALKDKAQVFSVGIVSNKNIIDDYLGHGVYGFTANYSYNVCTDSCSGRAPEYKAAYIAFKYCAIFNNSSSGSSSGSSTSTASVNYIIKAK